MRTKTLLLTAALSAAGVASSMAQGTVFSVNAVGYVNTTVAPKFSLISNPLTASDNTIGGLFTSGIQGTIPDGFTVYRFVGTTFVTASYDSLNGAFGPSSVTSQVLLPGEGVFVRNPGTAAVTITFVGEVPQGNLANTYPKGFSIRASQVPQSGTAQALGFVGVNGDQIFQFNTTTQAYTSSTYDDLNAAWGPALGTLGVGEAFFLKAAAGGTWSRTFSVNN